MEFKQHVHDRGVYMYCRKIVCYNNLLGISFHFLSPTRIPLSIPVTSHTFDKQVKHIKQFQHLSIGHRSDYHPKMTAQNYCIEVHRRKTEKTGV